MAAHDENYVKLMTSLDSNDIYCAQFIALNHAQVSIFSQNMSKIRICPNMVVRAQTPPPPNYNF